MGLVKKIALGTGSVAIVAGSFVGGVASSVLVRRDYVAYDPANLQRGTIVFKATEKELEEMKSRPGMLSSLRVVEDRTYSLPEVK